MGHRFRYELKKIMKIPDDAKRQAMDAISGVHSVVKKAGMATAMGGIGLYVAHIRQMERQNGTAPRPAKRDAMGREL